MRRSAATAHTQILGSTTLPLVREGIPFGAVTSRNGPHIQLKPAMIGKIDTRSLKMKCDELKKEETKTEETKTEETKKQEKKRALFQHVSARYVGARPAL